MPKKEPVKKMTDSQDALEELRADLQRVQADFVNFRRRSEGERAELLEVAKAAALSEILPLLDNLDRALSHLPADLKDHPWAQGVGQVAAQTATTLANLGLTAFGAFGDQFDPNRYEAISHDGVGHTVTEVFQKGYRLGDKVIRPAMVKVGDVTIDAGDMGEPFLGEADQSEKHKKLVDYIKESDEKDSSIAKKGDE